MEGALEAARFGNLDIRVVEAPLEMKSASECATFILMVRLRY